jgi:hypothetical protein
MKRSSLLLYQWVIYSFIMSCSEDEKLTLVESEILKPVKSEILCPTERINPKIDFNKIKLNENDKAGEEVNSILLESMEEIINAYEQKVFTIDDLYSFDNTKLKMGTFLSTVFEDLDLNIFNKSSIKRKIIHNNIECSPGIVYYNMDKCDKSKNPIFALGIELGEKYKDLDLKAHGKDIIAGIIINEGRKDTIIITEEIANTVKNPLIIITNHSSPQFINLDEIESINDNCVNYECSIQDKLIKECQRVFFSFRIDYRYDNSSSSEYTLVYTSHDEASFDVADFKLNGLIKYLADVPKADIGKLLSIDAMPGVYKETTFGSYYIVEPTDYNIRIMGMTFERDWYASRKSIYITLRNRTYEFQGEMTFSNEYYQIINAFLPIVFPCPFNTPLNRNGIYNGKGFLIIRGKLSSCSS